MRLQIQTLYMKPTAMPLAVCGHGVVGSRPLSLSGLLSHAHLYN